MVFLQKMRSCRSAVISITANKRICLLMRTSLYTKVSGYNDKSCAQGAVWRNRWITRVLELILKRDISRWS